MASLGQLGALPDDAEQNMRLGFIEKGMIKLEAHVDDLRIQSKINTSSTAP
jgi:hypothetical protein